MLASSTDMDKLAAELKDMLQKASLGGGAAAIEKQHQAGKLTARERLGLLLDERSFMELDAFVQHRFTGFDLDKRRVLGDGVVTGLGRVNGRLVAVYAQDATFMGGSLGEAHLQKVSQIYDFALKLGVPVVGLNDSGGARIQEGVASLHAIGEIFARNVIASGVVPQITAIMGPCAGGAAYQPALGDFTIMVEKTSYIFITGPRVVKRVTHEDVSAEDLGGTKAQGYSSGVAHFVARDENECIGMIKTLLSYLPSNSLEDPPRIPTKDSPNRTDEALNQVIPTDPRQSYDMREVIGRVFDSDSFFEAHRNYAQNAIIGFASLDGRPVGIVANQPMAYAGALDMDSSDKIARFVRFCDCFNFPIFTFVDTPGYLPGVRQEHGGIIRHGAKLIYAYVEASVPRITVVVRKAYGGAYIAMCSKSLGADMVFAYPTAEIAVMGPDGAVEIVYHRELEEAGDEHRQEVMTRLVDEYRRKFATPYVAAERGYVNAIIEPKDTRPTLIKAMGQLSGGRRSLAPKVAKKHGNIPL